MITVVWSLSGSLSLIVTGIFTSVFLNVAALSFTASGFLFVMVMNAHAESHNEGMPLSQIL